MQLAPLFDQALVDTLFQRLGQAFAASRTQEQRKRVDNRQHPGQLWAGSDAGESPATPFQPPLPGFGITTPDQFGRQHLTVTQRRGQCTQRLGGVLQLLHPRQPTQRPQQAAQAPQGDAQVMQGLTVGIGSQALSAGQQAHLQGQHLGNHMIEHGRHKTLLGQRPARDSRM
ncbi:hypothetical protein D3C77_523990 [compost metagenome]